MQVFQTLRKYQNLCLFMGVPQHDMSRYHLKRVLNESHEQSSLKNAVWSFCERI